MLAARTRLPRNRAFWLVRACLAWAVVGFTCSVPIASFAQDAAEAANTEQGTPSMDGSDTAEAKSITQKVNDAIEPVDAWFGKYLVGPLASFFFFDFYTGPRFEDGVKTSNGWLGVSLPFVVIWLLIGAVYLTLRMMFINIRGFFHAIALTMGKYDNPDDVGEVSHFQALTSALSATVGLGNIAGVAIAILSLIHI